MDFSTLNLSSYFVFLLLLIPIFIFIYRWKLGNGKRLVLAILRMFIQLYFVGFYLKYIFQFDNIFINIGYFCFMTLAASFTIRDSLTQKAKQLFFPIIFSVTVPTIIILILFNRFFVGIEQVFAAKYLIPVGGMLLGNCLRGNILALKNFLDELHKNNREYQTFIMLGASRFESIQSYMKESLVTALEPTIASIASIGLVSLPGMMTGQILGGASPMTAIHYQIAIMLGIFTTMFYSIILDLFLVKFFIFDDMDRINLE